jgi:hypothetical protein
MNFGTASEIFIGAIEGTDLNAPPNVFLTEARAREWAIQNATRSQTTLIFRARLVGRMYVDEPRFIPEEPTK